MNQHSSHIIWYPGHELIIPNIIMADKWFLWDGQGKRYVDMESGVWAASLGQGHPRINRVITEQLDRVAHTGFNFTAGVVEEVAQEILHIVGFDGGKCVFLCSGSEAVEYGVRVARMVESRPLFLTMADSYFGAYGSANRRHESAWYSFDWFGCDSCSQSPECEGCERWLVIPWEKIGAFVFEPGSSSGLVRFPPEQLIRNIVKKVKGTRGLVIVNEVTTGLGRTGMLFGHQHYGITPDVIATGKGVGNGYPVSVAFFAPEVVQGLGDTPVAYAQSHQNDPLGAVVAREVLRIIAEEGLVERAREAGGRMVTALECVKARTEKIAQIRARGMMVGVELVDSPGNAFTVRVHRELIERGFIVGRRPGTNVLRIDPCLTIDEGEIEKFVSVLEEVLGE